MGMSEWEADTLVDECLALQEAAFKGRLLVEAAELLILDLREDLRIEQQRSKKWRKRAREHGYFK